MIVVTQPAVLMLPLLFLLRYSILQTVTTGLHLMRTPDKRHIPTTLWHIWYVVVVEVIRWMVCFGS